MPLYEYECQACKNRFEIRQRIVEDPISVCPTCGGSCRRVIHPVGIVFKGSGFYITDNRKGESSASATTDTKTENKSAESKPAESKSAESKPSESKPAEKASGSPPASESKSTSKPASPATT